MDPTDEQPNDPRRIFWPPIDDEASARYVARHGFWAAVANVLLPLAYLIAVPGMGIAVDPSLDRGALTSWAIAEVALFVPIGAGLFYFSRIAAVAAPVAFIATKILLLQLYGGTVETGGWIVAAVWLLFYVQGIRGTFALAQYR